MSFLLYRCGSRAVLRVSVLMAPTSTSTQLRTLRQKLPGARTALACVGHEISSSTADAASAATQAVNLRFWIVTSRRPDFHRSATCVLQVVRDNLYDAFYKLTDSRSQITSYVFDVVRSTVPKIILDDVFTVGAPFDCPDQAGQSYPL